LINGIDIPATVDVDIFKSTNSFPHIVVCFVFFAVALRPIFREFSPGPVSMQLTKGLCNEPIETAEVINKRLKGFAGRERWGLEVYVVIVLVPHVDDF
jgi:hypothetical protein